MDLPNISLTSWAGIAAAGAMLGAFWRQFVSIGQRILDLVICRVTVKGDAARAVMSVVWEKGKRSPFGLRLFGGTTSYVFPKKRVEVVAYEGVTGEPLLFWFGRVPLLVGNHFTGRGDNPNIGSVRGDEHPITIRYIRKTFDADQFIEDAIKQYNDVRQSVDKARTSIKRFNVIQMHGPGGRKGPEEAPSYSKSGSMPPLDSGNSDDILKQLQRKELRLLTWKPDDLIERPNDAAPFAAYPYPPEVLAQFDEIKLWLQHETFFRSKGIPWRRGYLLSGSPGVGKDTLVRNLAMQHDLPVYTFDLSSYDNQSFSRDWKSVMQNAPAIALCSDIDAVWKGRENIAVKDKTRDGLTFDCFLNTISGVGSNEGVILFITTNHPETIDPALGVSTDGRSSRPGRIDKVIKLGTMQEPERRKLAHHILDEWRDCIEEVVAAGEGETAAQFQERCAQTALRHYWERGVKGEHEKVEHSSEHRLSASSAVEWARAFQYHES